MNIITAIRNWLFQDNHVTCPYCHEELRLANDETKCRECGATLDSIYINRHRDFEAIFVPVMGWVEAGKSVWLDSVVSMLVDINNIWSKCTPEWLTDFSLERSRQALEAKKLLTLPEKTKEYVHLPVAFALNNPPRWEGRLLILRDVPGEAYKDRIVAKDHIPFICRAPNTFLFADLTEGTSRPAGFRIDQLIMSYVQTLEENHRKPTPTNRRTAIVIIPKADKLDLPDHLHHFVTNDPLLPILSQPTARHDHSDLDMHNYMEQLGRASQAISEWFSEQPGGAHFIAYAKQNSVGLRFLPQ